MASATFAKAANPFPGLRPFRDSEEHLFFGRESQVDAMIDKLARTRFLAVVGASGSGKSSLVNCGLGPSLHRGLLAKAGTSWRMAQFRPGNAPIRAMARSLAAPGVLFSGVELAGMTLDDMIEAGLRMSRLGLADVYEQAQLGKDENLLIVVDQFEELFRYRTPGAAAADGDLGRDAKAFVNLLLEASAQAGFPIYIVVTMRSDFLGDCAEFTGLPEAINQGQYLVPRLTREERRLAIAGPVGVAGGDISPVLLTRLVNDVGDNPDQLSILQHALNRTWSHWQNEGSGEGRLELPHYEAIGTMAHALDRHAEKAYSELTTERERQICEKIFKALTDRGTDARGIRRPMDVSTLCALTAAAPLELGRVIEVFRKPSRSFLMPPLPEALDAGTMIDISHESLMRVWERLKAWANEEAESARLYRRVSETAALHAAGRAGLWRDPDLQLALDWRNREKPTEAWAGIYGGSFGPAMSFLAQSEAQRQAELRDTEKRQRRELEQEQTARSARVLRRLVGVIAVLFLLSAAAGVIAWKQREMAVASESRAKNEAHKADEQRTVAQKEEANARAEKKLADAAKSVAVAATVNAVHLEETANEAAKEATKQRQEAQRQDTIATMRELAFQADLLRNSDVGALGTSTLLAIESMRRFPMLENDHALRADMALLPAAGGKVFTHVFPHEPTQPQASLVAFSSDGRNVIAAGGAQLRSFALEGGKETPAFNLATPLQNHLFSSSGNLLAVANGRILQVLETGTGKILSHTEAPGAVTAVALSADGLDMAAAYSLGADASMISVFTTGDGKASAPPVACLYSVGVLAVGQGGLKVATADLPARRGRTLAARQGGNHVDLIDVKSGKEVWRASYLQQVNNLAFNAEGSQVALAGADGAARVIDAATGTEIARLNHRGPVMAVAFSPSGNYVASASQDNTARVFDASTGVEVSRMIHPAAVTAVAFGPGHSVVTASADGSARVFGIAAENQMSQLPGAGQIHSWALSPDGIYAAASDESSKSAHLLDANTGSKLRELQHGGAVNDVNFSPDGRLLTTASADGMARVFDVKTGAQIFFVSLPDSMYTSAISWDGHYLATSSADKTVRTYDIRTKETTSKKTPVFPYDEATTLGFSPDGRLLAAGNGTGNLTVFRLADGTTRVLQHDDRVNQVVFSPDGRYMATGSQDKVARVFATSGWKPVLQIRHQSPVPAVAFSWDGRYVISGGHDDTAQVFEIATRKEVARLEHPGGITAVAASHDNRIIVLSAKVISGHWFRPEDLIREACSRVTRNLSPDEWKQYMGGEPYRNTCAK
jgi:WD40 repeat protein